MKRKTHALAFVAAGLAGATSWLATGATTCDPGRVEASTDEPEDPPWEIRGLRLVRSKPKGEPRLRTIPESSRYVDGSVVGPKPALPEPQVPRTKLGPGILELIRAEAPAEPIEVLVTFVGGPPMRRLPALQPGEDRFDAGTDRALAIRELQSERAEFLGTALQAVAAAVDFTPDRRFWIGNTVSGFTTWKDAIGLVQLPEVGYVQRAFGGEPPPSGPRELRARGSGSDVEDARALIGSDPYRGLAAPGGSLGLLDTGVETSHDMLAGEQIFLGDCVGGGTTCDDTGLASFYGEDAFAHGTSSACVLTGNADLGAEYEGVMKIGVDSWRVYMSDEEANDAGYLGGGLDYVAVLLGLEAALKAYDDVLVLQVQAKQSENDAIALAADDAYEAGAVVVAANGNYGASSGTVRSPANAHKVLGVGATLLDPLGMQLDGQSRGPAEDGRRKPDVQAPTSSRTCFNVEGFDDRLWPFSGTSGATPYAGSVAYLTRRLLDKAGTFDNGQTYALMVLYGQNRGALDDTQGAGRIRMPSDGNLWWSKIHLKHKANVDATIPVPADQEVLDVALWWPESHDQAHNDVDVHVIDPDGNVQARGEDPFSVFERVSVLHPAAGDWTVRIHGYDVPAEPQVVYWAAFSEDAEMILEAGAGDPAGPEAAIARESLMVFERESFYRRRPEIEEVRVGTLVAVPVREGPHTRLLPFRLRADGEELPLYLEGFDDKVVADLVGREVVVRGKLVDLTVEGAGVELWPGHITLRP